MKVCCYEPVLRSEAAEYGQLRAHDVVHSQIRMVGCPML